MCLIVHVYNFRYDRYDVTTRGWVKCSLAWPDRFFPFFFVVAEKPENGKKRSGHARLGKV